MIANPKSIILGSIGTIVLGCFRDKILGVLPSAEGGLSVLSFVPACHRLALAGRRKVRKNHSNHVNHVNPV